MSSLSVLWEYRQAFAGGLLVTVELVLLTASLGTVAGALLEWACQVSGRKSRAIVEKVAFSVAAIPALVLLFWLHYPAQAVFDIVVPPFWTALVTLTILNAFSIYRIIADAFRDFPTQYVASGLVSGLSRLQITRHIQAPLLLRAIVPRWIDQQVVMLQTSVFASLISVEETFRVAQRINSTIYQPVTIYTAMALLFVLSAGSLMHYSRRLRERFGRDLSER